MLAVAEHAQPAAYRLHKEQSTPGHGISAADALLASLLVVGVVAALASLVTVAVKRRAISHDDETYMSADYEVELPDVTSALPT